MGLTLWRWIAGVALGCAGVAFVLLPFPPQASQPWFAFTPAPLAAETGRLSSAVAQAYDAVRAYRSAVGLDRWRSATVASDTMSVRIEKSLPAPVAHAVRAVAADQWNALGPTTAAHAEIFVYADSSVIPRASNASGARRPIEPRKMVDVVFALPEATDGKRCVALVRLRGVSSAHVDALRHQSLLGVCGFFAAFGLPGDNVHSWLTSTGYRVARRSDWHVAIAPAVDATALYALGDAGGRCLTSEPGACLQALQAGGSTDNSADHNAAARRYVIDGPVANSSAEAGKRQQTLGHAEVELLRAAVREFGPERFGRFWRASSAPDSAFLAATGVTLDAWTQRWLTRTYGALPPRPSVRARDVVWLALAMPLLVVVAVRPRESVLGERLFARRA